MPFQRPSLSELQQQAMADVAASQLGAKGLLRRAALRVLTKVQAGLAHLHYGYLDWIWRQATPFTATGPWLEAWAALVGVLRKGAAASSGTVLVQLLPGAAATTLPRGTVLRRSDGAEYATAADLALAAGGSGSVAVTALVAGAAGNADDGTPLVPASTVAGFGSAAASGRFAGGADQELDDGLRTRMLARYRAPPQGGAAGDYPGWALAVPGVTRAWCNPLGAGAGTVVVYTMWDLAEAAQGGFPQGRDGVASAEARGGAAAGDQVRVADALYPLRPVTALVYSCAPAPAPVAFQLRAASTVPAAVQALALAAIDRVFLAWADPLGGTIPTDPFVTALAVVPGMPDFSLLQPQAPVQAPLGSLPVRGAVSFAG